MSAPLPPAAPTPEGRADKLASAPVADSSSCEKKSSRDCLGHAYVTNYAFLTAIVFIIIIIIIINRMIFRVP